MTFRLRPLARALLLSVALSVPAIAIAPGGASAQVDITVSVNIEPPGLPVYDQPPIPEEGYLWTPGYWAWDATDADYFWVPGAWVQPPQVGLLWTPGYWGWSNGVYVFNEGYWGETVGFYGGVDLRLRLCRGWLFWRSLGTRSLLPQSHGDQHHQCEDH
jgi:hypothetical protein